MELMDNRCAEKKNAEATAARNSTEVNVYQEQWVGMYTAAAARSDQEGVLGGRRRDAVKKEAVNVEYDRGGEGTHRWPACPCHAGCC